MTRCIFLIAAIVTLSACQTPLGGQTQFGRATTANIALQSVRPITPNNHTDIEGGSGGRAGQAVERLRDGEIIKPTGDGVGG